MNLEKLLEIQGGLDAHMIKQHPEIEDLENNDWKFLALHTEISECANEWRGFKVWSADREPRTKVPATAWGEPYENPLLEEYADGLHLILSIGNDMHIVAEYLMTPKVKGASDITQTFLQLHNQASGLNRNLRNDYGNNAYFLWAKLYYSYLELGNALGFSEDEVEAAYLKKNKANHERQQAGY